MEGLKIILRSDMIFPVKNSLRYMIRTWHSSLVSSLVLLPSRIDKETETLGQTTQDTTDPRCNLDGNKPKPTVLL